MKKSKLILLTILMILVLYCGAVIFVTKPNSFAYSAILGDGSRSSDYPAQSGVQTASAPAAEVNTDAIIAEAKDAAAKQAESTIREYASQTEADIIKAIEQMLPSLIDEAVKKAVEEQNIPKQIADKVSEEIESRQYEFASMLYRTYKESLVDELSSEVIDRTKEEDGKAESVSSDTGAQASEISKEEYDAQRKAIRDSIISSFKNKLEN